MALREPRLPQTYQHSSTLPVPVLPRTPCALIERVPHLVSLVCAFAGVAVIVKLFKDPLHYRVPRGTFWLDRPLPETASDGAMADWHRRQY